MRIYCINISASKFKRTTQIEIANTKIRCGDGLSANITDISLLPLNNLRNAKKWICEMIAQPFNKMLSGFGTKPTVARSLLLTPIQIEKYHPQKNI